MRKTKIYDKYKYYRNLLSTVIKKSKNKYYNEFFKKTINNIKTIWKGIRNLITRKQSAHQGNERVSNPKKISNIFNDYFSAIAEKTKAKIKFSNKSHDELFKHANKTSFFLKPTASVQIINLILS